MRAAPDLISGPVTGFDAGCFSGFSTLSAALGCGFAVFSGSTISGAFAAGGTRGAFFGAAATSCTGRVDIGVIPCRGPGAPPREIMIVRGVSARCDRQLAGIMTIAAMIAACAASDSSTVAAIPSASRERSMSTCVAASCIISRPDAR